MKRAVQILGLALLVAGLTLPSVSYAGKIAGSGMIKHKAFTEENAPVQQKSGSIEMKTRPISGWRLAIGTLFSAVRCPGIVIVIIHPPTTETEEPFKLQDPPWEKRPRSERPEGDDHGWEDN